MTDSFSHPFFEATKMILRTLFLVLFSATLAYAGWDDPSFQYPLIKNPDFVVHYDEFTGSRFTEVTGWTVRRPWNNQAYGYNPDPVPSDYFPEWITAQVAGLSEYETFTIEEMGITVEGRIEIDEGGIDCSGPFPYPCWATGEFVFEYDARGAEVYQPDPMFGNPSTVKMVPHLAGLEQTTIATNAEWDGWIVYEFADANAPSPPVPEPSSAVLLSMGLAVMGLVRRKR